MATVNETKHAETHPWECKGYKDPMTGQACYQRFKTEKDLRRHKKSRDDHDYCAKCNKDFAEWEDLVKHKSEEPIMHPAACRVCGEDFGSISGMKRHLAMSHPVDQNVPCIGCGETFPRASAMIYHLENANCKKISAAQFSGHLAHKTIVSKLLNCPEDLEKINVIADYQDAAIDYDEQGGVAIGPLEDDHGDVLDFEALQPEKAPSSVNAPRFGIPFPPLGSIKLDDTAITFVNAPKVDVSFPPLGPIKGDDKAINSLANSVVGIKLSENGDSGDGSISAENKKPWSGQGTSKTLFPTAKPTPVTEKYQNKISLLDENSGGINLFNNRFWDPTSKDFDPKRFFHPILCEYLCPFPQCEGKFQTPRDIENHIMRDHRITDLRCPSCLKIYKTSAALVSHMEAPNGRCHVARSDKFSQTVDQFSGGFLNANYAIRPDHKPHENPEVETVIDPATGLPAVDAKGKTIQIEKQPIPVGYNQYEATKPSEWVEQDSEIDYLKWTV